MLKRLNLLDKQHGGAIPFSALVSKGKKKTKKKTKGNTKRKTKKIDKTNNKGKRNTKRKTKRNKNSVIRSKGKGKGKKNKCACGTHTYTGGEVSPTGIGKCSECIPLNVVMKGKDNALYENTSTGWIKI